MSGHGRLAVLAILLALALLAPVNLTAAPAGLAPTTGGRSSTGSGRSRVRLTARLGGCRRAACASQYV